MTHIASLESYFYVLVLEFWEETGEQTEVILKVWSIMF